MPDGWQTKTATFAHIPCPEVVTPGMASDKVFEHEETEAGGLGATFQIGVSANEAWSEVD